jgi:hypothetical protein
LIKLAAAPTAKRLTKRRRLSCIKFCSMAMSYRLIIYRQNREVSHRRNRHASDRSSLSFMDAMIFTFGLQEGRS